MLLRRPPPWLLILLAPLPTTLPGAADERVTSRVASCLVMSQIYVVIPHKPMIEKSGVGGRGGTASLMTHSFISHTRITSLDCYRKEAMSTLIVIVEQH